MRDKFKQHYHRNKLHTSAYTKNTKAITLTSDYHDRGYERDVLYTKIKQYVVKYRGTLKSLLCPWKNIKVEK